MEADLEIIGNLDQPVPVAMSKTLAEIDLIIERAREFGDVNLIFQEALTYIQSFRISGMALAKLLHDTKQIWNEFGVEEAFEDEAMVRLGLAKATISRYIAVYDLFDKHRIPEHLEGEFLTKPIRQLVPIGKMLEQGYEPDAGEWEDLAQAPDNTSILKKVREIKGVEARKSSMMLFISRTGELTSIQEGRIVPIGYLYLDQSDKDEQIAKAIKRIIDTANIMEN